MSVGTGVGTAGSGACDRAAPPAPRLCTRKPSYTPTSGCTALM